MRNTIYIKQHLECNEYILIYCYYITMFFYSIGNLSLKHVYPFFSPRIVFSFALLGESIANNCSMIKIVACKLH